MARRAAGRGTNLALLVLLVTGFATGGAAFAIGSAWVRWIAVGHGVAGIGILTLTPWKSALSRRSLRRRHFLHSWPSLAFASLVVATIASGLAHSTGVARSLGGI